MENDELISKLKEQENILHQMHLKKCNLQDEVHSQEKQMRFNQLENAKMSKEILAIKRVRVL